MAVPNITFISVALNAFSNSLIPSLIITKETSQGLIKGTFFLIIFFVD